jgi:hypothetical protein
MSTVSNGDAVSMNDETTAVSVVTAPAEVPRILGREIVGNEAVSANGNENAGQPRNGSGIITSKGAERVATSSLGTFIRKSYHDRSDCDASSEDERQRQSGDDEALSGTLLTDVSSQQHQQQHHEIAKQSKGLLKEALALRARQGADRLPPATATTATATASINNRTVSGRISTQQAMPVQPIGSAPQRGTQHHGSPSKASLSRYHPTACTSRADGITNADKFVSAAARRGPVGPSLSQHQVDAAIDRWRSRKSKVEDNL